MPYSGPLEGVFRLIRMDAVDVDEPWVVLIAWGLDELSETALDLPSYDMRQPNRAGQLLRGGRLEVKGNEVGNALARA